MLSPLKPSAPSASLLRFLRSLSGVATGSSACVRPKSCATYHEGFVTASRRSSSWAHSGKSESCVALDTALLSSPDSRPKPTPLSATPERLILARHASTNRRPLIRRLFDLKRSKAAEYKNTRSSGPAFIDDDTEGIFNIGRGLAAKASNELRIRCTEFDSNGDVTLVNGEFRKLELIAKVSIEQSGRDMSSS